MRYLISVLVLFVSTSVFAKTELLSAKMEKEGEKYYFNFTFDKPVTETELNTSFIRRTIEWDLKDYFIRKDKKFITLNKEEFKNIYISLEKDDVLKFRLNLSPSELASSYNDRVSFLKKDKKLTLVIDKSIKLAKEKEQELSRMYDIVTDMSNHSIASHLEQVATFDGDEEKDDSLPIGSIEEEAATLKPENEIPLNLTQKKAETVSNHPLSRLAIGSGVLIILLASLYIIGRKINAKRSGGALNNEAIHVVSQKYLGPKRTLTLVRIAGEYMLLGVTDHNISLIKTLSIVDDELPQIEPNNFSDAVKRMVKKDKEQDFIEATDEVEDRFTISSLDDVKKLMNEEST